MIICLGTVCVPVYQLWIILICLIKPFWTLIKKLTYKNSKENNITINNISSSEYPEDVKNIDVWHNIVEKCYKKNKLLIVKFSADFCKPCKDIEPLFINLKNEFDCMLATIDVENESIQDLVHENNVKALPTFIIFEACPKLQKREIFIGADIKPIREFLIKVK